MVVDEVIVKLEAQIADYKRKLGEAENVFDRTANKIERRQKTMSARMTAASVAVGSAVGMMVGSLIGQLPGMLIRVTDASLKYAAALKSEAQALGVSTTALQEYRFVAGQIGIAQKDMDEGFERLTKTLGDVQAGTKRPIKALTELGFSVEEIARLARTNAADALPMLADKLKDIENPAERARIELALFGETGQRLDALLSRGSGRIDELRDAAHRLGVVLSDRQIQNADVTAKKMDALRKVLAARIAGVVADNAGAIVGLTNALAGLVNKIPGAIAQIQDLWDTLAAGGNVLGGVATQGLNRGAAGGFGALAGAVNPLLRGPVQGWAKSWLDERNRGVVEDYQKGFETRRRSIDQRRVNRFRSRLPTSPQPTPDVEINPQDMENISNALAASSGQRGRARGGAGGGGKTAADLAREAAEKLARYNDEQDQLQMRMNTALADLAGTQEARAAAEKLNLDIQQGIEERRINLNEDYTAEQKKALIAASQVATTKEKEAIDAAQAAEVQKQQLEATRAELQNDIDLQQASNQFVKTREMQLEAALHLLDLQYQMERLELEAVEASETSTAAQKAIARERLRILGTLQGYDERAIREQHRSPGQKALADLEQLAMNVNDELEQLAVDKVRELASSFGQAASQAFGLSGAIGDIVSRLIEMALQTQVLVPLMRMLFGAGGSSGPVDFSDPISGGSFLDGFMAGGGTARAGGSYIVGEKGPELFIPAQTGTVVPADQTAALAGGAGGGMVEVHVVGGEMFDARVARVSGPVAAKVVHAAAPAMSQLSMAKTVSQLGRPHL